MAADVIADVTGQGNLSSDVAVLTSQVKAISASVTHTTSAYWCQKHV